MTVKYKRLTIAASVVILVVIATATVLLLNQRTTKPQVSKDLSLQVVAKVKNTLSDESNKYTIVSQPKGYKYTILVNGLGTSTVLNSTTDTGIQFTQKISMASSDTTATVDSIKSILLKDNYEIIPSLDTYSVLARFTNSDTDCQLSQSTNASKDTMTFEFACANIADHSNEVKLVDSLLKLWKNKTAFDYVTQDSFSNGTYELKIIGTNTVSNATNSHTLLYIHDNGVWKYLADASEGDQTLSNGKFILNADVKAAMADPNYGSFVKQYISPEKK